METFTSQRLIERQLLLARVALFDFLIDLHHDGQCTFDEAIAQYQQDSTDLLAE